MPAPQPTCSYRLEISALHVQKAWQEQSRTGFASSALPPGLRRAKPSLGDATGHVPKIVSPVQAEPRTRSACSGLGAAASRLRAWLRAEAAVATRCPQALAQAPDPAGCRLQISCSPGCCELDLGEIKASAAFES